MELYIEKETVGKYGLVDTFIDETISLNTKTTYTQDITVVFKGFTNSFSVQASPNNIKLLGYFGFTEQLQPALVQKKAKLFLDGMLFKEGIITLENTSWINSSPSLFQLSFSDGQKNLTEILGDDSLSILGDELLIEGSTKKYGDFSWTSKNIQNGLQSIQTAIGGVRWFVPLVSTNRIFSIDSRSEALPTDNIFYDGSKHITSENVFLAKEARPAMFMSEILDRINKKYDIKIDPTPFIGNTSQLTDLCTMCNAADVAVTEVKAKITKSVWDNDAFREERFNVIPKPLIDAFELRYLGYGAGSAHDATFGMIINLTKKPSVVSNVFGITTIILGESANASYINSLDIWEVNADGTKKKKLNYSIVSGSNNLSANIKINIGLDVFTPDGGNAPSTLVKPLISIFVSAEKLSEWKFTNVTFDWSKTTWKKFIINNVQPQTTPTTVNLFKSLPEMKIIDFVKSIYTMFGYKKFKDEVLNDFNYVQKTVDGNSHKVFRKENDLTPYADLSKMTKKTNTKYDGYNLKHFTSDYQQNKAFAIANGMEWGQLKYPLTGKPKTEFLIETKFTAPVFNPILSNADTMVYTFYPFGSEPKLNESQTRYIYDANTKEFPIFYYNRVANISTPYAFVDDDLKMLRSIGKYHKISHKNNRIFTGVDNYITSLFNIISTDYIDQNTLYVQGYKGFIEDTLSGRKLIHTIDLILPNIEIQKFNDNDEVIIKETKYNIMESTIGLTDGKCKLILLNK